MRVKRVKKASEIIRKVSDMSTLIFEVRRLVEVGRNSEASNLLDTMVKDSHNITNELMLLRVYVLSGKGDDDD